MRHRGIPVLLGPRIVEDWSFGIFRETEGDSSEEQRFSDDPFRPYSGWKYSIKINLYPFEKTPSRSPFRRGGGRLESQTIHLYSSPKHRSDLFVILVNLLFLCRRGPLSGGSVERDKSQYGGIKTYLR